MDPNLSQDQQDLYERLRKKSEEWVELREWVISFIVGNDISLSQFLRDILLLDEKHQKSYSSFFCRHARVCPPSLMQEISALRDFCLEFKKARKRLRLETTPDSLVDRLHNIVWISIRDAFPDVRFEILSKDGLETLSKDGLDTLPTDGLDTLSTDGPCIRVKLSSRKTEYLKEIFIEHCLGIPVDVQVEQIFYI